MPDESCGIVLLDKNCPYCMGKSKCYQSFDFSHEGFWFEVRVCSHLNAGRERRAIEIAEEAYGEIEYRDAYTNGFGHCIAFVGPFGRQYVWKHLVDECVCRKCEYQLAMTASEWWYIVTNIDFEEIDVWKFYLATLQNMRNEAQPESLDQISNKYRLCHNCAQVSDVLKELRNDFKLQIERKYEKWQREKLLKKELQMVQSVTRRAKRAFRENNLEALQSLKQELAQVANSQK